MPDEDAIPRASDSAPVAPNFALSPDLPRAKLTRGRLDQLSAIYQTDGRQIRRWFKEGAPIDAPHEMPAWWTAERAAGRKTWDVPEKILAAARAHPKPESAPAPAESPAPNPADPLPDPAPDHAPQAAGPPINLEDFDPEEGEQLRDLKQLKAARWAEIRAALKAGRDATSMQNQLVKLEDQISRISGRIEARLEKKGLLIHVSVVKRDLAKAVELMRQMSESEARRVTELVPGLPPEMKTAVMAAIRRVGDARLRVLRNLKALRSHDHAIRELAAA